MFTNIEGDWDEVMSVVKQAVDEVALRYPRVGIVLKADIRPGHEGSSGPRWSASRSTFARSELVT